MIKFRYWSHAFTFVPVAALVAALSVMLLTTNGSRTAFAHEPCGASGVQLVGYSDALDKTSFDGLPVSELSGLTYDPGRGVYYAVADRSGTVPAHFFTLKLPVSASTFGTPTVEAVTLLRRQDATPFTGADFDGEGIVMNGGSEFLVVSEGGSSPALPGPSIRRFAVDGAVRGELPTPPRYFVAPSGEGTGNLTWESLALSPSGMSLFTANEAPLSGDGQTADLRSRIRIQRFYRSVAGDFMRAEQYFYLTDAGRTATDIGVADMLALSDGELLVLERGFRAGEGNTVRIYRVSILGAQDVGVRGSLAEPELVPLAKNLFVDLSTCPSGGAKLAPGSSQSNPLLDNFEAIALGPVLAGNTRTLLLISDDNGATNQTTRVVELTFSDPAPAVTATSPFPPMTSSRSVPPAVEQFLKPAAEGAVERRLYASGQAIDVNEGVFFMDTSTGVIEAWTVASSHSEYPRPFYSVSPDNRFIQVASGAGSRLTPAQSFPDGLICPHFLIDRHARAVWTWDCFKQRLARFYSGHILFEETEPEAADGGRIGSVPQVIAYPRGTGTYLVLNENLEAAAFFDSPELASWERRLRDQGTAGEFFQIDRMDDTAWGLNPVSRIRRESASGELLGEFVLKGKNVQFSPDGRLIAWQGAAQFSTLRPQDTVGQPIDWPTVVIADAHTGEPRFRLRSAALCHGDFAAYYVGEPGNRWLADSSGVVVQTAAGYFVLSARDGSLKYLSSEWVSPSPDDPQLFAVERSRLFDLSGGPRPSAIFAAQGSFGPLTAWGRSGSEIRFTRPYPFAHGGGFCGLGLVGPVAIEHPPFDDVVRLTVVDTGSCLNIRRDPTQTAERVTCLADGSRVIATEAEIENRSYRGEGRYIVDYAGGEGPWVHVRSARGQEGWASARYLQWVP